jgi:hypothetical protein
VRPKIHVEEVKACTCLVPVDHSSLQTEIDVLIQALTPCNGIDCTEAPQRENENGGLGEYCRAQQHHR